MPTCGPGGRGTSGDAGGPLRNTQRALAAPAHSRPPGVPPRGPVPARPGRKSPPAATASFRAHLRFAPARPMLPGFPAVPRAGTGKRPFRPALPAHRHPPCGVRAPGFRVELVQAVDALELGALCLLVQSPLGTARGRREQPGAGSSQAPVQEPGGRHVRIPGRLPVGASFRGPRAPVSVWILVPRGF